jgi:hypothetical protein
MFGEPSPIANICRDLYLPRWQHRRSEQDSVSEGQTPNIDQSLNITSRNMKTNVFQQGSAGLKPR